MDSDLLRNIVEAALLAAGRPLAVKDLQALFEEDGDPPATAEIEAVLRAIEAECAGRGYELKQTASGYRFQVRARLAPWISRLWEERPQRYSRALLETLALIAYRQPITRGDIEEIRGVSVSSQIIKTMQEREWIRVVGHRDVPGRPALYATTRQFLDYFSLRSLEDLPALGDLKDLNELGGHLTLDLEPLEEPESSDEFGLTAPTAPHQAESDTEDAEFSAAEEPERSPTPSNVVPLKPATRRSEGSSHE